jgi:hypothetical protein
MNIEQLKTEWQRYNEKLSLSQRLNDQMIVSMMKERSRSRIAKIRQENILHMISMVLTLAFLTGIFIGNPFDFEYSLQYVPYGLLAIGVLLAIATLVKSLQSFRMNINKVSLDIFLRRIIDEFEKSKRMQRWFGTIMFSAGVLTAFSFFPKKYAAKGLWLALGETGLMIAITVLVYVIAFKAGAFKNRKAEAFENDLRELNELKAISAELKAE